MKVLVIAAHPDDETFGMGGTILRHIAHGDNICVLVLADGATARGKDAKKQEQAFECAMRLYGISHHKLIGLGDQRLEVLPVLLIVKSIEEVLAWFKPDRVYTHSAVDVGQDHRRVHEAAMIACRPVTGVKELLCFPCPSSTFWGDGHFMPRYYVDITPYQERKEAILTAAYSHECPPPPHPRAVTSVRRHAEDVASRMNRAGQFEEFEVIRMIG